MQSHGLENKITFQTNVSSELYGCAAHLNKPRSSFKSRTQILVVNTYGLKGLFNMVNLMLAIQLLTRLLVYESCVGMLLLARSKTWCPNIFRAEGNADC